MNSDLERPRLFDPQDSLPVVAKLGFPLIIVLAEILLLQEIPKAPLWFLPPSAFGIPGLFFASMVLVHPTASGLEYLRLVRWRRLSYADVTDAGVTFAGWIGWLRLRRWVFPFGRLYFIVPADFPLFSDTDVAHRKGLLQAIRGDETAAVRLAARLVGGRWF